MNTEERINEVLEKIGWEECIYSQNENNGNKFKIK